MKGGLKMGFLEMLRYKWENSILYELLREDEHWYDVHLSNGKMMHVYVQRSKIREVVRRRYPKKDFPNLRIVRVRLAEYTPA